VNKEIEEQAREGLNFLKTRENFWDQILVKDYAELLGSNPG
jgi:hypothetical protein